MIELLDGMPDGVVVGELSAHDDETAKSWVTG